MTLSRRYLVKGGLLMAAAAVAGRSLLKSQSKIPDRGPRLDDGLVREFVGAGHGNLDKVKEMLAQQPALLNATWDWGGGDWETALGGASHMGNQPIAEYLLSKGARMDVFCAVMMGKTEIVKAFLADDPNVVNFKGPHGISLLRHARAGKQEAIVAMLVERGAKE